MANKFRGKELIQHIENVTANGLLRASEFYRQKCFQAVSVPNTGVSVKVKRHTEGGNKTTRTIYPQPSLPGEPPRLRTGFGRKNIVMEFDRPTLTARVGIQVNAIYMFYLELGTRRIAPRPWLVPTLINNLKVIGALAATKG